MAPKCAISGSTRCAKTLTVCIIVKYGLLAGWMTKRRFAIVGAVKGEIQGLDLCKYSGIQYKNYQLRCNFLI